MAINTGQIKEGSKVRAIKDLGWVASGPPAGGPAVSKGTIGVVKDVYQRGSEGELYFIRWNIDKKKFRTRKPSEVEEYRTCRPSEVELI